MFRIVVECSFLTDTARDLRIVGLTYYILCGIMNAGSLKQNSLKRGGVNNVYRSY